MAVVLGGSRRAPRGEGQTLERPLCLNPSQAAQGLPSDLLALQTGLCKSPPDLNSLKSLCLRIIRIQVQLSEVDIFYSSRCDHLDPNLL